MPDYQSVNYTLIDTISADDLRLAGITIHEPKGLTCISEDRDGFWKEVGRVVVWADRPKIDVYPYILLNDDELGYLRGAGWRAWMNRPTGRRPAYWTRRTHRVHGYYYESHISLEAFANDRVVRMIQAARGFRGNQDQQFQRIYDATV